VVELRLVRETDSDRLYDLLSDLDTRGASFALGVMSETTLRAEFNKSSFWDWEEGMLLMVNETGKVVGEIEYFPIARYLQGCEISYQVFRTQSTPGRGTPPRPHFPNLPTLPRKWDRAFTGMTRGRLGPCPSVWSFFGTLVVRRTPLRERPRSPADRHLGLAVRTLALRDSVRRFRGVDRASAPS
jgi:hypothetical protein